MSPRRLLKRRYAPLLTAGLVILIAFAFSAWAIKRRTSDLNSILRVQQELTFQQCVSNEIQDAVIVAQLQAAKRRARSSLPPGPELQYQLNVINDGIAALEPPGEPDCVPPEGSSP